MNTNTKYISLATTIVIITILFIVFTVIFKNTEYKYNHADASKVNCNGWKYLETIGTTRNGLKYIGGGQGNPEKGMTLNVLINNGLGQIRKIYPEVTGKEYMYNDFADPYNNHLAIVFIRNCTQ